MNSEDVYHNFQMRPEEREAVDRLWPQYLHKTDKLGRPFYLNHAGVQDVAALYKATTTDRLVQNCIGDYEFLVRFVRSLRALM